MCFTTKVASKKVFRVTFCDIFYKHISLMRKQMFNHLSKDTHWVSNKARSRTQVSDCKPPSLSFHYYHLEFCNCPILPRDDILNAFHLKKTPQWGLSGLLLYLNHCKRHPNQMNLRPTISDSGIDKCFIVVFASHDIIPRS